MIKDKLPLILCLLLLGCACKPKTPIQTAVQPIAVPELNVDSAYLYTAEQVAFGPRVPNTPAHKACSQYLAGQLRSFGGQVI